MKKFTSILVLMLITAGMASAQPQSLQVEPGSKGELPELPTMGSLEENHFVGLWFNQIELTIYSSNWYDRYADFEYPDPSQFEATHYILQCRPHVENSGWMSVETIEEGSGCYLSMGDLPNYSGFDFRLVIGDGPYKDYISNEVSMDKPGNIATNYGWSESEDMYKVVGSTVGKTFDLNATTYRYYDNSWHIEGEYNKDDGYYRYKWYRMNPNTWEMTLVEGANASSYETSMDDCGYMLVMEINGDEEHCSLLYRRNFGEIVLPVQASLDYVGADGFVLNTDYVVPVDAFTYNNEFMFYGDEDTEYVTDAPVPAEIVSQRKPGQYVFRLPNEEYDGVVYDLGIPGTMLSFVYMAEWNDPPTPWYREAQVMSNRYLESLIVKPQFNGELVNAEVEVYARNIDGEWALLDTDREDMEEGGVTIYDCPTLGGGCYIKALKTDTTLDTYYPNALLWADATPVIPGYDEEWNLLEFAIDLQPIPAQLAGTGVIEGTITVENTQSVRRHAPADASGINVFLRQKGGDIIANEVTNATGSYRFENVPLGTYEVLVNIDGCTMDETAEVTLTDENNTASGIDYTVEDNIIAPTGESGQTTGIQRLGVERQGDIYDLQGRRVSTLKKGIYIQGGSKFVVK